MFFRNRRVNNVAGHNDGTLELQLWILDRGSAGGPQLCHRLTALQDDHPFSGSLHAIEDLLLESGSNHSLEKQKAFKKSCEVKKISATETKSGRVENLIRCSIPIIPDDSKYGISIASMVVESDGLVYLKHFHDSTCGFRPKISVDGKRIRNDRSLVDGSVVNVLGSTSAVAPMLKGETADIQTQQVWPYCQLSTHTVFLHGLLETVTQAKQWVANSKSVAEAPPDANDLRTRK